jgi:DNA-binding MarR family transcriptional regulator
MPVDITKLLAYRLLVLSSAVARWTGHKNGEPYGLKLSERRVLSLVGARGPISANEVSKIISIDKGWVSRTIPRLVKRGLVKMTADPKDRRRKLLVVTTRGAVVHRFLNKIYVRKEKKLIEALTAEELGQFRRSLQALQNQADRMLDDERGEGS